MKYIKLNLCNRGGHIEESKFLYVIDKYKTDSEIEQLIRKYKIDYRNNLTSYHSKQEEFEYVIQLLTGKHGFEVMKEFDL